MSVQQKTLNKETRYTTERTKGNTTAKLKATKVFIAKRYERDSYNVAVYNPIAHTSHPNDVLNRYMIYCVYTIYKHCNTL